MSIYGAMFAPDQERTAAELLRVTKPGGRIGMANWTPDGGVGEMFMTIAKHTGGRRPGSMPPVALGHRGAACASCSATAISELRVERRRRGRPSARPTTTSSSSAPTSARSRWPSSKSAPTASRPSTADLRAYLEEVNTRRRAGPGARARVPAGDRDPRLVGTASEALAPSGTAAGTTRIAAPISRTAKKTRPATGPPWPSRRRRSSSRRAPERV